MEYELKLLSLERGKVVSGSVIPFSVLLNHFTCNMYNSEDYSYSKCIETQYLKGCLELPGRVSNLMPLS